MGLVKRMGLVKSVRSAALALALFAVAAPATEAAPFVNAAGPAARMDDGLITPVQARPGGGRPAGAHRPVHRPPVHRPPAHRPPVHRPPVVVVPPRGGWTGRPGWYRWSPGGAIAAGAALGFLTATAAGAFAGPPPQQGLCWYYTDPSRRQGFWDACP